MTDARTLTLSLGGTWHGHSGSAPCPVCQPERRHDQHGLSLKDRADGSGLLIFCFKFGCDFRAILAAAWLQAGASTSGPRTAQRELDRQRHRDRERRAWQAQQIWSESLSIAGTLAETYLRGRGITCELPPTLRYHPACWHQIGQRLPTMVALIEGTRHFAVHRTYLRPDGSSKADVDRPKAMLGPVSGGAVRLSAGPGPLVVAEGIETALSLANGLLSSPATIWAALGTSGFMSLNLPPQPGELILAMDGDRAGREAGNYLARVAARLGWSVSLLPAPEGQDWNDVLQNGPEREVVP